MSLAERLDHGLDQFQALIKNLLVSNKNFETHYPSLYNDYGGTRRFIRAELPRMAESLIDQSDALLRHFRNDLAVADQDFALLQKAHMALAALAPEDLHRLGLASLAADIATSVGENMTDADTDLESLGPAP